jgi:hypothetical protein
MTVTTDVTTHVTEESMDDLKERLERIEQKLNILLSKSMSTSQASAPEPDDETLLSYEWADKEIRWDPKRWSGSPLAPIRMSQAPVDYLECYASLEEWRARKDEASGAMTEQGKPKADFSKMNARLARAWARRSQKKGVEGSATDTSQSSMFDYLKVPEGAEDQMSDELPF